MREQPHVLIVEDEPSVRDSYATLLRRRGYTVLEAGSADRALEVSRELREDEARLRVVLLNLTLPDMRHVLELAPELRRDHPYAAVIAMTARGLQFEDLDEGFDRYGVFDFIEKPSPLPQLEVAVLRASHYSEVLQRMDETQRDLRTHRTRLRKRVRRWRRLLRRLRTRWIRAQRQRDRSEQLLELVYKLLRRGSIDEMLETSVGVARRLVPSAAGLVLLCDEEQPPPQRRLRSPDHSWDFKTDELESVELGETARELAEEVLQRDMPILLPSTSGSGPELPHPIRSALAVPIRHRSGVLGVLVLFNRKGRGQRRPIDFSSRDSWMLQHIAAFLEWGFVSFREGGFDILTGLPNRRLFEDLFRREVRHVREDRRGRSGVSVFAILDVDHFKVHNTVSGYRRADRVLKAIADQLKNLRPGSLAGRWGGEEFGLLLTGLESPEVAFRILDRLRRDIRQNVECPNAERIREQTGIAAVTVSIGYSDIRREDRWRDVFDRANDALNRAKESRNRVEPHVEDEPEEPTF
jgi:diguanylate cyclase (GGDEF)-like protein